MAAVENISIALPAEIMAAVRQAVQDGEYTSSSEAIRDALQDWTDKRRSLTITEQELQTIWRTAIADESKAVSADGVLDRLEQRYQAMADSNR